MISGGFLPLAGARGLGRGRRVLGPPGGGGRGVVGFHLLQSGTELLESGLESLDLLAKGARATGPGLGQDAAERRIGLPQGGFHPVGRL